MTKTARRVTALVLTVVSLIWLVPSYLLVVNAFTRGADYSGTPAWWPTSWSLFDNIGIAFRNANVGQGMLNSLVYSVVGAGAAVFIAALASFAVTIMPLKRPTLWFWVIYIGTILPLQAFLSPLFTGYASASLFDTQYGMVLVYVALTIPFAFFVVRGHMTGLPVEVREAASLDGAGWARVRAEGREAQGHLGGGVDLTEQQADGGVVGCRCAADDEVAGRPGDADCRVGHRRGEHTGGHRPAAKVAEFVRLVQEGSIGLSAMPYNLHTDTCSTEELHELLREARRIREQYGIDFTTAMQTDVPGQVAGLPDALQEVGVRYLAVAHNWAGRSMPHQNGALALPRLFRWTTPAGNAVLVWMTDSPHGLAYMEGPMVGLTEEYEVAEAYLPAYLTALATRGYPFPPGVFGAHGEEAEGRPGYPWGVLHLRTQGFMGDNGPARLHTSEVVRRWNDTWSSPTLRVSTNAAFFAEAEERYGAELTTVQGDWGDWWVEGVGSAAVPLALTREAQATVADARSFSQAAAWLGGAAVPTEQAESDAAWDAISMFNEHTWGASNSWTHGDEGYDSGERQWQWKVGQAIAGHQRGVDLREHALVYLADAVPAPDGVLAATVIANASGSTRTGVVRFLLKESTVPLDQHVALRDGRTGQVLEHVVESQGNALHRESGRWVSAQVPDVPGFGFVRLDVVPTETAPAEPRVHDAMGTSLTELFTLENAYLRVSVDPATASIRSVVERTTDRELVEAHAPTGFNAYVYDEYGSSGAGVNHLANKLWSSDRLELLASRTAGRAAVLVERVSDAVEERLVYAFSAPGVDRVVVTLRLRHGEPRLRIANRLEKPVTRTKESAFFAFPFAAREPVVRYEVSGGVTGDGIPHVPGAPQHMRAIRHWASVEDGPDAVVWVTKDAPLVHPGAIALPYAPFPASTSPAQPATIYSWLHNNVWDTNFPIEQGFTATFEYAVGVRAEPSQHVEAVALQTTADLVRPLAAVPATGGPVTGGPGAGSAGAGVSAASAELLALDDDRVQLVSVVADGGVDASLVRLQSVTGEPVTVTLTAGVDLAGAERTTYLGDHVGDTPVVDARRVRLDLAPYEVVAVRLRRA